MTNEVSIKLTDDGIIEIDGVKISIEVIPNLVNPPEDCLLSLKRIGKSIEVTRYETADAAVKFFQK